MGFGLRCSEVVLAAILATTGIGFGKDGFRRFHDIK